MLKQDNIKKRHINENKTMNLYTCNNKSRKYKVEIIYNNAVYKKNLTNYLARLCYLVL